MSLATAAPTPLTRQCGGDSSGNSALRKLTTAASLYEAEQPGSSDDGAATGAAAWLQQQRLHLKVQDGDCAVEGVPAGRDREREEGAEGGKKQVPQHQQHQPVEAEDVHLQQLLASEGLMRCETLNLFRAQLQQLSRRKDGLMPRADGSFPENWLLLAWEYQGLAEEVMSCQRWPGKYPEGLLRCVTHQVLYLKHRLEAFPTMSGAERDQFRRLYVLAALGIIAKLKLVTFCWTFVELKRGGEMAEQVSEVGRRQQSWQLQLAGNTTESLGNLGPTPSSSAVSASCREALSTSAALPSESVAAVEVPSVRPKKKIASHQVGHDIQSSASDTSRPSRKKEDKQRLREEHQQQELRTQEHERSAVKFVGQQPQEGPQQQGRQRNEGEQRKMQEETISAEDVAEDGRESALKENAFFPLSLAGTVALEAELEPQGKSEEKTEGASEDKTGTAQEVSNTCSLPSQRTEDLKEQQAGPRANESKLDGTEGSKKTEGKQREQLEGATPDVQEDGKAEAPEKTKYTTRSGRRTHRVKADAS